VEPVEKRVKLVRARESGKEAAKGGHPIAQNRERGMTVSASVSAPADAGRRSPEKLLIRGRW
jgi:hypothetical protein